MKRTLAGAMTPARASTDVFSLDTRVASGPPVGHAAANSETMTVNVDVNVVGRLNVKAEGAAVELTCTLRMRAFRSHHASPGSGK